MVQGLSETERGIVEFMIAFLHPYAPQEIDPEYLPCSVAGYEAVACVVPGFVFLDSVASRRKKRAEECSVPFRTIVGQVCLSA